jgi:hypothetical protein
MNAALYNRIECVNLLLQAGVELEAKSYVRVHVRILKIIFIDFNFISEAALAAYL